MNTIIIPILIYILEIVKYYVGNKLLFEGKVIYLKKFILSVIIYFLFAIFCNLPLEDICLISYIAAGISVFFLFNNPWKIKIFRIISILAVTACLDEIIGIIISCYFSELTCVEIRVIIESFGTVCIIFAGIILKNKFRLKNYEKYNFVQRKTSVLIICLMIGLGFMSGGLLYAQKYITDEKVKLFYNVISVFSYGCIGIVVIFIIYMKDINEKMKRIIEIERVLKQMSKNYFFALLKKEEDTRRYRHDMNNHILCLKEYAKKEKAADTLQYIDILQNKLDNIQKKIYFTGNDILDILLNYYLVPLENIDISVIGTCKDKLKINDVDFCIIISNLIQNAVEEIIRLKNTDRYIRINIEQGKKFFKFEIRNGSETVFSQKQKFPETKKNDKKNHGIGLANILETVEYNQGMFEIKGNGEEVCAIVVLPVETDRLDS